MAKSLLRTYDEDHIKILLQNETRYTDVYMIQNKQPDEFSIYSSINKGESTSPILYYVEFKNTAEDIPPLRITYQQSDELKNRPTSCSHGFCCQICGDKITKNNGESYGRTKLHSDCFMKYVMDPLKKLEEQDSEVLARIL